MAAPLTPPQGVIPDLDTLGWQPVLSDDFNGNALDESVWHTAYGTDFGGIVVPEAASVGNGALTLTAYTGADGQNYAGSVTTGYFGTHNPTWGGFDATYGYVEARIKMPDGPGTGTTFWMESANNIDHPFGDPGATGPEVDVVEHGNSPASGPDSGDGNSDGVCDAYPALGVPCSETLLSGGHIDGFEEDHKALAQTAVKNPGYDPANAAATSLRGNFHTYGLLWTPEGLRYYLDGIETYRSPAPTSFFPEHLILTSFVSNQPPWDGHDYGSLAASDEKSVIDYVTVWQRPISEIPDQTVVANRPVTVPFTVTDDNYSGLDNSEPGSVRVTAHSSAQAVVPDSNIVVTGNGPADPDGSFANGSFDTTPVTWTFPDINGATAGTGNNAQIWGTRKYGGSSALHLSEVNNDSSQKGRAEQTITGLRPNTTYQLGIRYDLELGFVDNDGDGVTEPTDGNGRPDPGEPFTEAGETETDSDASFDFGVADVDASRSGSQEVKARTNRFGGSEAGNPAWWKPPAWPEEQVKFTTGPSTTSVVVFASNEAYAGSPQDADVTVDSMWLRAVVPPTRAVTLRPIVDTTSSATVTLTAVDSADNALGTEEFTVNFKRGSTFTNGDFEAAPLGSGWWLAGGDPKDGRGAQIVVDNPFRLDRVLQLAAPATTVADGFPILPATYGVASQSMSGLTAGASYDLSLSGKGNLVIAVQEFAGAGSHVDGSITTSNWSPTTLTFTPTGTTAKIVMVDWSGSDGASFADDMTLTQTSGSPGPVSFSSPTLTTLGEQRIPSEGPSAIPFDVATSNGSTLTVTSDNPEVLPAANAAATRTDGVDQKVLALTPLPGRTGKATVSVTYTDGSGQHTAPVPVVVSDSRLVNPGFEGGLTPWNTTAAATALTSGMRSGAGALQINATSTSDIVTQIVGIPENTQAECLQRFTVTAWAKGNARLTVRQPWETGYQPAALATLTWANPGSWTEQHATFTSPGCFEHDTNGNVTKSFEVRLEDTNTTDGVAAQFDDLSLVRAPEVRTIRDMSLHQGQTSWQFDTARDVSVGRVAANSFWDPSVVSVTSSNQQVLPDADIERRTTDSGWPFLWQLRAKASPTKTGRSTVTLQLADPFTGTSSKSFVVTVNAGTTFNNGDLERGLDGWSDWWCLPPAGCTSVFDRQAKRTQGNWNPPATDYDNALRLGFGVVAYQVKGLAPSTDYRLNLSAVGTGSTVAVRNSPNVFGGSTLSYQGTPAEATIDSPWTGNPPATWPTHDLTFTTGTDNPATLDVNEVDDVWIVLSDGTAAPDSSNPCVTHVTGESCFDDLGVFKLADL